MSGKAVQETVALPVEAVAAHIPLIRGHKVMLDADLAELYGVPTKVLVQAVKRNLGRFPGDFMFQLSDAEFKHLRSQSVTSSWGGRRYAPYGVTPPTPLPSRAWPCSRRCSTARAPSR